ncbi:MAG: L-histidine N(alpha)-methyltransferase [Bacteroidota bacterium]|nr:L-histidine N(alpha)-methyltransferase [Bacteroidota bacterium]MDX5430542.1 L-histidine N(alpha)-methyltransferase [Bacteroidota bacterium]MDX5469294.1 L-histidine N(alpha)-methyltransferase [Bacteroidota bacterium]
MKEQFAEDLLHGLCASAKRIPSRYFYDEKGSKLFQRIMQMPEYYLTPCETKIFQLHADEIAKRSYKPGMEVIEFGVGDGTKTQYLLKAWLKLGKDWTYVPIDIEGKVLKKTKKWLAEKFTDLTIHEVQADFFEALEAFNQRESQAPRLILFLGSNIGNFTYQEALAFMRRLHLMLNPGDQVLIGVDLKKNPAIILPAYSDAAGLTAAFNLNLLERINRELGGHFNVKNFKHYASYEPESGEARSYLISQKEQEVLIERLNRSFHFKEMENIQTEVSKKYAQEEFERLVAETGFQTMESYFDPNFYFMDTLLERS